MLKAQALYLLAILPLHVATAAGGGQELREQVGLTCVLFDQQQCKHTRGEAADLEKWEGCNPSYTYLALSSIEHNGMYV